MQRSARFVRRATSEDTEALAALMTHLGYPTPPDAMRLRMARIAVLPEYATWVAEADGAVIGMAGAMRGWGYNHDAPYVRLTALVVGPEHRGQGTGAALVRAAEDWARTQGAASLHLTTRLHRADAHRFYLGIGFEETGKRFYKSLD
jgi:GNAT superfamily N-acetyltransferase